MAQQKLSENLIKIAEKQMAEGGTRRQLALAFGVSPNTVSEWYKKGKAAKTSDKGLYRKFYLAVQSGESQAEKRLLEQVEAAATGKLKTQKTKVVRDGNGNVLQTVEEEAASVQLKAILWQLEHKYGWGNHINREKERVLNYLVRLAEKELNPDQYHVLLQAILDSKLSDELNLDGDLLGG